LLDTAIHAGANVGLVEIDLSFGERCFCAGPLCREERADARRRGLFGRGRGVEAALATRDGHFKLFDIPLRHDAWIAPLQFALDVQFVVSLLQ